MGPGHLGPGSDMRNNFDIYLPEWLSGHNELIFGALYVVD